MARARRASLMVLALLCLTSMHASAGRGDPGQLRPRLHALQKRLDRASHRAGRAYHRYVWAGHVETRSLRKLGRIHREIQWIHRHPVHPTRARKRHLRVQHARWHRRLGHWSRIRRWALHNVDEYDARMLAGVQRAGGMVRPLIRGTGHRWNLQSWRRAWPLRKHRGTTLGVCPVQGPHAFYDTFGAPRPGGRRHQGNDLFAPLSTPVVAAQAGRMVRIPNTLGGRAVHVFSRHSYTYYAHVARYAGRNRRWVRAGAVIGYVGHTGNAWGLPYHLHFEFHPGRGDAVDPYTVLERVC